LRTIVTSAPLIIWTLDREGRFILSGGRSDLVLMAEIIAPTHHECLDGSGYPGGFRADDIPLIGRIVSIIDVFDALTHERPYKCAWPVPEALNEIAGQRGLQFDRVVVETFSQMHETGVLELPPLATDSAIVMQL
jgi:HD-GYP domain-containing protein (c-di-GMP phosphodiesterase class II)